MSENVHSILVCRLRRRVCDYDCVCHSICHVCGVYAGYDVLICAETLSVTKEMVGVEGVFLTLVVRTVVFPRPAESVTAWWWSLSAAGLTCLMMKGFVGRPGEATVQLAHLSRNRRHSLDTALHLS